MRVLLYACSFAVLAGSGGCAYLTAGFGQTGVRVENRSTLDVDLFIWDGDDRATRLGFLAAGDSADFRVPRAVIAAPGPYYIEARGLHGGDEPAYSDPFALQEGATVVWQIPPREPPPQP